MAVVLNVCCRTNHFFLFSYDSFTARNKVEQFAIEKRVSCQTRISNTIPH